MDTRGLTTKPLYWTRWRVMRTLNDMLAELESQEKKSAKGQTLFLKKLFVTRRISRVTFMRWGLDYGDDDEICNAIVLLKDILEVRAVEGAMQKNLDPFMTLMHLKNNYGWKDAPDASERDDKRLENETDVTRQRLARVRRDNLLNDGDSTNQGAA